LGDFNSQAAVLLMGGIALTPASAADLGGDCCADLEERVAELEATTIHNGNRKVSLKLSGHVNRMLFWWDDGINDDVYSVDNGESETRFRLAGDASIMPGLSAGFRPEVEVVSAEGQNVDDRVDGAPNENSDGFINARKMEWNLKHDQLGKISVGCLSSATDDLNQLNIAKNPLADADLDNFRDFHFVRPHGTLGCNGAACRTTLNLDAGMRVFESDIRAALPAGEDEFCCQAPGKKIPTEDLYTVAFGGRIQF